MNEHELRQEIKRWRVAWVIMLVAFLMEAFLR